MTLLWMLGRAWIVLFVEARRARRKVLLTQIDLMLHLLERRGVINDREYG